MKLLFSISLHNEIGNDLLHPSFISRGGFLLERFKNQELHISLQSDVQDKICILLGTIAPPDSNLVSFLSLAHTLKKNGAKKCIALLPYLAYTRHEHDEPNKSRLTPLIGNLFKSSGIDEIITIDIHSNAALSLFPIPVTSLSPASIFAEELKKISFIPNTIVAPDKGALKRAQDLINALNLPIPLSSIEKKRDGNGIMHSDLIGPVGEKIVIVDDILDTGETLVSCSKKLINSGAKELVIMVSHGVFSENPCIDLSKLKVKTIYTTNTIPIHPPFTEKLSITPLLKEYLWKS